MTRANPFGQVNDTGWCRCAGPCGRVFGGLRGFDAHRINTTGQEGYDPEYDWRCATDEELRGKGYIPNRKGWWLMAAEVA